MIDVLNAALGGTYRIEREIGRGGMATIWLARDLRHDRDVAIKVLAPELAGAIGVDRFLREIRLTARLRHPGIIPVLDSGVLSGPNGTVLPWYSMAWIDGESLRRRLQRERNLPLEDALRITEETAAALEAAHREGILHRDIKPENLLLQGGHVFVADFGIAKAMLDTGPERLTSTGLAVGTPAYMSPEQAAADSVDARTDQYSLACVLYEMLAGEPPFTGPTAHAVMARRMAEPARPIRSVRPAVPVAVEAATLRALERVPADRFPDVAAFAAALRRAPTAGAVGRPRRIAIAIIGVAVLLGIVIQAIRRPGPRAGAVGSRDSLAVALYQRGVRGYDQRTPAGIADAIQAFTAAVTRDSAYGKAWAGLAAAYSRAFQRQFLFAGAARDSALRLAVAAVDHALTLDRRNADVWVSQAIVSQQLDPTDATPVFRSIRQALALDSANAPAWHFLAMAEAETGDMAKAVDAWRRAVRLQPTYTQALAFLALGFYWRRQYDSAARWADSAIAIDPNYLLARTTAGQVDVEHGNTAHARADFETARRLSTDVEIVNAMAETAMALARADSVTAARAVLQRAETLAARYTPAPLHTSVYFAAAYAALHDAPRAVSWLRRYTPRDDLHFQLHLRCDPWFAPIEHDASFKALLTAPAGRPSAGC